MCVGLDVNAKSSVAATTEAANQESRVRDSCTDSTANKKKRDIIKYRARPTAAVASACEEGIRSAAPFNCNLF